MMIKDAIKISYVSFHSVQYLTSGYSMVDDGWTAYDKVHQTLKHTHAMEAFNKDNWKYDKNIPFTYKSMYYFQLLLF